MATILRRRWLAGLAAVAALARGRIAEGRQQPVKGPPDDKPSPLWLALLKAIPEQYRTIDIYAENPSRTLVLFQSRGETLIFNGTTGMVQVIAHQRALGRINQITFEVRPPAQSGFILWLDGVPQLTILAKR